MNVNSGFKRGSERLNYVDSNAVTVNAVTTVTVEENTSRRGRTVTLS